MQKELTEIFKSIPGNRIGIVETGTFHGTGTTQALYNAAKDSGKTGKFVTIEVNPDRHETAVRNLQGTGIQAWLGLSLKREILPSIEKINEQFVAKADMRNNTVFYDHTPETRAYHYTAEVDFKDVPDNLLEKALLEVRPNVVLLDSAGHLGHEEFEVLEELMRQNSEIVSSPFYLVLDDTRHCKHVDTLQFLKLSPHWDVIVDSDARHGWCIAKLIQ